jgi:hypothetical protein
MKVLIHPSSCTALLGSPAERWRPWLWGEDSTRTGMGRNPQRMA